MTVTTTIPPHDRPYRRILARTVQATKLFIVLRLQALRRLLPAERRRWKSLREDRLRAETLMTDFAKASSERFEGAILIDGTFDNANYWLRFTLIRAALGIAYADEVGFTGRYAVNDVRSTFARFGIGKIVDRDSNATRADRVRAGRLAEELIGGTKSADDVLQWRLPFDYPAAMLYDDVLKRQRGASLDISDPLLFDRVREVLIQLFAADRLIDRVAPRLVLLSHVGPLAWISARRDIMAIVLTGHFGVLRFFKVIRPEQVFDPYDHPTGADIEGLPPAQAEALAAVGRDYIERRLSGRTDDIGSRLAHKDDAVRFDRAAMTRHFGWDYKRPIVVVYTSNWFDYPHYLGMSHFRDFLDWLEATLEVANDVKDVNWLFKGHPVDAFYGGITLADLMPRTIAPHIAIVPEDWSGFDVRTHVDALITYHGTAGVEYGATGKPVLLADRGWYHDCGFAMWPRSREDYLAALRRPWWRELNLEHCARQAQIFSGWLFASPSYQKGFILSDDSDQWKNYASMPVLLGNKNDAAMREADAIKDWFHSDARFYHTFKMGKADSYCLAGVLD